MHARIPRVNLLVVGPEDAVEEVLGVVVGRDLKQGEPSDNGGPVVTWCPGTPFMLPPPVGGMLILRNVDTLVHADQQKLVAWLEEAAGRVQVVSTASSSLMPLVDGGVFLQALYYRLNTIYMDLTDPRIPPGDW